MTRSLGPALAGIALVLAVVLSPGLARADVEVTDTSVENGYPDDLTFRLSASSDQEIVDVTLHYAVAGRGVSGFAKPEEFTPGTDIDTEALVRVNSSNSYVPVATTFRYSWEIATADGEVVSSPDEEFLYLPNNRDWEWVENETMRVFYHGDREDLALSYLEAGDETFEKIAVDLLQTELPVTPVNVVLFANSEDMAPARQGRGGTFDAAVTTCGTKLTVDIVFVIPVSCGTPDVTDTLRHEFGHIINQAAGEGSLARLPSWIDEGTAVVAQSTPGDNFEGAFEAAVRGDRLTPFNQMGTPSNDPGGVNLFYGQSWAMVDFLIDRGGPQEYARFFATMKSGERFDRAIEQVYGFTLAGFEDAFREAHGLPPRSAPADDPTEAPVQSGDSDGDASPTRAPLQTTGSGDGGSGIDQATIVIVGVAVLFALIAVFFYLLGAMTGQKRAHPGGSNAGDQWRDPPEWRLPPPPDEPPARTERLRWDDDDSRPDDRNRDD